MDRKGTQPCIYLYPFSPTLLSHPACHITLSRVPCAIGFLGGTESETVSHSVVSDSLQSHGLYSPPGSSVHGILQARILEWVAISFSSGSSRLRDQTQVFHIVAIFCTVWATREALVVKNPPAYQCERQEMQVRSLGWEDPLEKETETHSSVPAWRIPTDRGAWWAIAHKVAKSQTWLTHLSSHICTMCYTVSPCRLSIFNIRVCTFLFQTAWLYLSPILPPGNHKFVLCESLFAKHSLFKNVTYYSTGE